MKTRKIKFVIVLIFSFVFVLSIHYDTKNRSMVNKNNYNTVGVLQIPTPTGDPGDRTPRPSRNTPAPTNTPKPTATPRCTYKDKRACENAEGGTCKKSGNCYVPKDCGDYGVSDCPSSCYKTSKACKNSTPKPTATPTPTPIPCVVKRSNKGSYSYRTPGEGVSFTVYYTGSCSLGTPSCTNCTASSPTSGSGTVTDETESWVNYTIRGTKECSNASFSLAGQSGSFMVTGAWSSVGTRYFSKKPPKSIPDADKDGYDTYVSGRCSEMDGFYECPNTFKRACAGKTVSEVHPKCYRRKTNDERDGELVWSIDSKIGVATDISKENCKNCYADNKKLTSSNKSEFTSSTDAKKEGLTHFIKGASKYECIVFKDYSFCDPTDYVSPSINQETDASVCEDNTELKFKDGRTCPGNKFYDINCENKIIASFDNGDDGNITGTTNSILKGQGFAFGIKVKLVKDCKAEFYGESWKTTFKKINDEYEDIKTRISKLVPGKEYYENNKKYLESRYYELNYMLKSMVNYVTEYNGYTKSLELTADANINILDYKVNGKKTNLGANFESILLNEGKGVYSNEKTNELSISKKILDDLKISNVVNPKNYNWSNSSNPRVVKLMLPKSYIDKKTGEVAKEGLDGGNKLYTDYDTDIGTYTISVTVEANGKKFVIKNNKCLLNIGDVTYKYRPIEVSNPFINSEWKRGANWVNKLYDFTGTIHKDTWKEPTYSTINVKANEVGLIKASNKNNQSDSPYLGLCDRVKSTSQDAGTKLICEKIKNIK